MSAEKGACVRTDSTDAVLEAVHQRIGTQKFNAWFKNAAQVSVETEDIKVGAANPFIAGWIESHFAEDLAAASREITGRRRRVTISVDPTLSGRLRTSQLDLQANLVDRGTAGTTRGKFAPAPRLRYKLEDFVTGSSNKLAYSAALTVAENSKVTFNPLFIHGTCGVGKTHLLQGICNAVAKNNNGKKLAWKYITAERFTNEFVQGIRYKKNRCVPKDLSSA